MLSGMTPAQLLPDVFFAAATSHPARPAIADTRTGLTYGELADAIDSCALALSRAGLRPGDRVVLVGGNSVHFVIGHFGIMRAGGVSVPVAANVPAERLEFIARDCDARLIHGLPGTEGAVLAAAAAAGRDVFDARPTPARQSFAAPSRAPDDLACLMYTTGSTGRPKGVMLSHATVLCAVTSTAAYLRYDDSRREAIVLPLSHNFGLGHLYCTLFNGGFAWLGNGIWPLASLFTAMKDQGINAMPATPSMLRLLLGAYRKAFEPAARGLRQMVVNSEPLPPEMATDILGLFPGLQLVTYYGLTEASRSSFLWLNQVPANRYASAGRAAPHARISIMNESGGILPAGQIGEIVIAGGHLAQGYWNRPDEQAEAFRDGWLRTGDLGMLDEQQYLTITGRLKDQINVGGLKVSAREVELCLARHPGVADVAVVALADPAGMRGEKVAAAVVRADGDISERALIAHCTAHLEPHMTPHMIRFFAALPRAESGKILKGEVQKLLAGES